MFDFMLPIATYPDPTAKSGLLRAIDLAASVAGRLSIVVHEVDIPPIDNAFAEVLIDLSALSRETEAKSHEAGLALVREAAHTADRMAMPHDVETIRAAPFSAVDRMIEASRRHDATLCVLDHESSSQVELTEGILFGSGGPVLISPAIERSGHLRSVVVAWDGSRAAARAVRDAIPVLKQAVSVTVLTAGEDKAIDSASVDGIRAMLERHGIESGHRELRLAGRPVGDALQEEAASTGAGLVVMGAYGHSRLRELMLGGATASVLRKSPLVPVFMSH